MVGLLELFGHVLSDLADAVERSVSDLWIGVFEMLNNNGDHHSYLGRLVNILTDLGEGHDTGVFVSPVGIIRNRFGNKLSNQREHDLFTNTRHESIHTSLSKVHVVFFFICIIDCVALLGSEPRLFDVIININHELEHIIKDVLQETNILFDDGGLALDYSHDKFEGLMADRRVCKFLVLNNWDKGLVNVFEVGLKKCGLDLSKLIKLYQGVLKHCLFILLESNSDHLYHLWQELDENLGIFALGNLKVVADGLHRGELDIERVHLECFPENTKQVLLVVD